MEALSAVLVAAWPPMAAADTIAVMWDASERYQRLGYIVRLGTQTGNYLLAFDVGNTTTSLR